MLFGIFELQLHKSIKKEAALGRSGGFFAMTGALALMQALWLACFFKSQGALTRRDFPLRISMPLFLVQLNDNHSKESQIQWMVYSLEMKRLGTAFVRLKNSSILVCLSSANPFQLVNRPQSILLLEIIDQTSF